MIVLVIDFLVNNVKKKIYIYQRRHEDDYYVRDLKRYIPIMLIKKRLHQR